MSRSECAALTRIVGVLTPCLGCGSHLAHVAEPPAHWSHSHVSVSSRDVPLRCSGSNIPRARLRTLKMSLVIVSSFILCWTPYYLLGLWYWFCPRAMQQKVPPSLSHILFIFGLFNACLDPITYGLFTIPFRRRCGCPCGHSSEPEPPSPATGSFHCSASSLRGRQGMGGTEGPHPPIELGLPTGAGSCQSSAL